MAKKATSRLKFHYEPNIILNEEQKTAKELIHKKDLVVITGRAGCGKTITACEAALDLLARRSDIYSKIVITRPYVMTEDYGFLPGDLTQKLDPNYVAIKHVFYEILDQVKIDQLFEDKSIDILPTGFSRGITLKNSIILLDEAQNFTVSQIFMLITRLGLNSKMIITGDVDQSDLAKGKSCLPLLKTFTDMDEIGFVELVKNNRHPLVSRLIEKYQDKLVAKS